MDRVEQNRPGPKCRPWYRLHLSTWFFLLIPAAVLALANVPGEDVVVFKESYGYEETTCEHGWPCVWLVRQGIDGRTESPWALTDDVGYLDGMGLAADFCVAAVLLALVAAAVEWRRRRRHRVWQFTLGDLLLAVLIVGYPLKVISERRSALERFSATANGLEPTWEVALPTWLRDELDDVELVQPAIWWLGLVRPDEEEFYLPDDQSHATALRSLLDCGAPNVTVTVENQGQPDDGISKSRFDPAALRSLAGLHHLVLERADDEVLGCLDSLCELRSLAFEDECGTISPVCAARLKGLTRLRSLRASRKCLGDAGIAAVASLTNLEALSLTGATDDDVAQLDNLKRLRYLALDETTATDAGIAHLAALSRLEKLDLRGYQITGVGVAPLAGLPRLGELDLGRCGLTDAGLAGLEDFILLRKLRLSQTPITGSGLSHIARCRRLRQLDLSGTEIDDTALASLPELPSLEELDLSSALITHDGLGHINRFRGLRTLWLTNTRATNLRALDFTRLPNLTFIDLDRSWVDREERARLHAARREIDFCRVHRHGINPYSEFERHLPLARARPPENTNPIRVYLEGSEFGDREVAALQGLAALETLRLDSTRVTDGGLAAIGEFDRLELIDLTAAPVGDVSLIPLCKLPRLKHLDLSYTAISADGLAKLAGFPALEVVGLDPSQVTVSVIRDLKRVRVLNGLTINRKRAPWGKQYRGARDFDEFVAQLREDLPGIDVSVKDNSMHYPCVEF